MFELAELFVIVEAFEVTTDAGEVLFSKLVEAEVNLIMLDTSCWTGGEPLSA
jgi:hypothetical protein